MMNHECISRHFSFFMFRLLLFQGASSSQHSSPISWIEWCIRLPSINFIFSLFSLFVVVVVDIVQLLHFLSFNPCIAFFYIIFIFMLFLMFTELRARYFLGWKNENERRINGGADVGTNIVVAMVFYVCEESEQRIELKIYVYKFIPRSTQQSRAEQSWGYHEGISYSAPSFEL